MGHSRWYQLTLHFTSQDKQSTNRGKSTSMTVHNEVNESRHDCKMLGVHLDEELRVRYNHHAKEVAVKGIKAVLARKRLK